MIPTPLVAFKAHSPPPSFLRLYTSTGTESIDADAFPSVVRCRFLPCFALTGHREVVFDDIILGYWPSGTNWLYFWDSPERPRPATKPHPIFLPLWTAFQST